MAVYYVSSTSELVARMGQTNPGDTIYLAPGVYDRATIRDLGTLDITIASQDADNPAILTGMAFTGTNSVRFSNLVFEAEAGARFTFQFKASNDLTFSGIEVRGPDNVGTGNEAMPLLIRESTNITVVDSEFYNVFHGLNLLDVTGVVVAGNTFHDIRVDGIRGGGVSNALITGNSFTDFHPIGSDHPDAIQLWSTDQDEPGRNIVITDNVVWRGDGAPVQGIFIRDTFDDLPFENVTISGNVVLGGLYNGIMIDGVIGGEITNNIVIGYPDQRSWIRVEMDSRLDLSGNAATHYILANEGNHSRADNQEVAENVDFYSVILNKWIASGDSLSALTAELLEALVLVEGPDAQASEGGQNQGLEATDTHGTWRDDELVAQTSGSQLFGDAGNDVLIGRWGNDELQGGWGNDNMDGGRGWDKLYGASGNDQMRGGGGNDELHGGEGHDSIDGGTGADSLFGGQGADRLNGGEGRDKLFGGGGHDLLFGGEGNDILVGNWGNDRLLGGLGSDQFMYFNNDRCTDTILDFESGIDRINLRALDADTTRGGDQNFTFIRDGAFSGTAGELRYQQVDNGVMVQADTDGDGEADFHVFVEGLDSLESVDFVF